MANGIKHRSYRIDCLKALAIVAICLYHVGGGGAFAEGYLGVEIFFPISGYFMMKGVINDFSENTYSAFGYITKQLKRLWLPVLLGAGISLGIGYFVMLPDNYENLAESVVASSLFMENILEAITTKNYWDIVNLYKPLMHLWYVGVLVQTQFFLALVIGIVNRFSKNKLRVLKFVVAGMAIFSFILYILPIASDADKFYLPWFRLYEILFGALIAFFSDSKSRKIVTKPGSFIAVVLIMVMLFVNINYYEKVKIFLMLLCTCYLLLYIRQTEEKNNIILELISRIGAASFSIYIVHQIIVAYMYYCLVEEFTYCVLPWFIIAVGIASLIMYIIIENPSWKWKKVYKNMAFSSVLCCVFIAMALFIYARAGVVKNVPELDISMNNYHRGMHAEYCDRPYAWNKDFETNDKIRVLVLGNSFGRDWVNILVESSIGDNLEVSYLPFHTVDNLTGNESVLKERVEKAEKVFFVLGPDYDDVPEVYKGLIPAEKLYIVGNKNFGKSNGIIYSKRASKNYFDSQVTLEVGLIESNREFSEIYKDRYINLLECVLVTESSVRVFTDDGKFISQDCRHLTQNGAKFFADKIDWKEIFEDL